MAEKSSFMRKKNRVFSCFAKLIFPQNARKRLLDNSYPFFPFDCLGYQPDEEKVSEVKKLLCCGTFYFSWSNSTTGQPPIDLTLATQKISRKAKPGVTPQSWKPKTGMEIHPAFISIHISGRMAAISSKS